MQQGITQPLPQSFHCCLQEKQQAEAALFPPSSYRLVTTAHHHTTHCIFVKPTDTEQQVSALFTVCPCLLPVITNTQPSQTLKNWHAQDSALSTALQLSVVAREKSIHSRDVSTQQHLWLNTVGDRHMCSFICKEAILHSTQEQQRARIFTRPLPLQHLLQKHIKTLHIFSIFILGALRTSRHLQQYWRTMLESSRIIKILIY